ncbi:major facilitator superfamily MFS-1 protein [Theileria orientalis]|uniref:Major facilitator superfamily MFS-1 protein n=1 Tax=Theileria orientalis TaxID=68886 RepID=A0A976M5F5_THEOR|nr:major facilitator superfamily MFS-1 protein [Theileria orientalis]
MEEKSNEVERKSSSLIPIKPWQKLVVYLFMIIATGCTYWGWNGIQELLYKAGSFEEMCKNQADSTFIEIAGKKYIDCGNRKSGINNLFSIAYSAHFITSIFTGYLINLVGPKYCYIGGQAINFIIWLIIGFFPKSYWALRISFFIIGVTAESLYMPLLSVSYKFENKRSLVISFMGSARSLSFLIPTAMSLVYQLDAIKPESLYMVCLGYGIIAHISCLIIGFLIVDKSFDKAEEEKTASKESNAENVSFEALNNEAKPQRNLLSKIKGLKAKIKKGVRHPQFFEYIGVVVCCSIFLTSIGFVNQSHREMLVTSDKKSAVQIYKYIIVLSFVPAPVFGKLIDMFGAGLVLLILHSCCFMYYFCVSFDVLAMKVIACVFFFFSVSLCISSTYCYINQRFPRKYFGILVGFSFLIAGLTNLTNIALYDLGSKKWEYLYPFNFRRIAYIIMAYMILCIISSSSLYMFSRKKVVMPKNEKSIEET